jgi:glycosyltransferase involved in cell wall biosynthesis
MAGAERVLFEVKKIYPDAPIYTSVFDPVGAKEFAKFDIKTSYLNNWPFFKSKRELLIPYTPLAFESFDFSKYDVVVSSTSFPSKGIITKPNTVHICYCHTPSRYLWEPQVDPRASKGFLSGLRKKVAHKNRIWDIAAAERVDYYIANSHYVAKRIKKFYHRDSVVVYPPVDVEKFSPDKNGKTGDYFLFVSRLVGYKRCDLVIDAFNKLGLPLKVIGRGPEKEALAKKANKNIEFLGFLSDDEIKKYYCEAKAFIFAAEEDFGIVPVEAMASGRPVIAYGIGGAAETIVPGVTGEFFTEQTTDSLIAAVKAFDPKKYDTTKIRKHAEKFSSERFRNEFKTTIDKLVSSYTNTNSK